MNIILFMSDTFRRDNLSCYGPTAVKTPNLDRFAGEAFVFDNANLGSFPTLPCRLDIMSGRFSHIDHEWCPLPADTVTLQQILSASGVTTRAIYDNPHLTEMGYFYERGFESWEWIRGQETDLWRTIPKHLQMPGNAREYSGREFLLKRHLSNTTWWRGEEDRFAARTVTAACRWLEENQDQEQFFLYLDLFDPHAPWDAPRKYIDLYDPGYRGEPVSYPDYRIWREWFTEAEMEGFRLMYRAEVSMVDHWFGVLMDKLDELGLAEDTAVIFVSDHGHLFGEHDLIGMALHHELEDKATWEATFMYSEIRRVPLLIRLPGQRQGRHVSALVQTPDLMPTILEMAGMVASETIAGKAQIQALQCGVFFTEAWQFNPENIHGKSLMPLMRGDQIAHRDIAVSSNTLIYPTPLLAKSAIVTEDGWCLHYAGHYEEAVPQANLAGFKIIAPEIARLPREPELYYLPDDPGETRDLIHANEPLAREIHRRYVSWLEEAGAPEKNLNGRRKLF